jgi:hypothetical protein
MGIRLQWHLAMMDDGVWMDDVCGSRSESEQRGGDLPMCLRRVDTRPGASPTSGSMWNTTRLARADNFPYPGHRHWSACHTYFPEPLP